MADLGDQQVQHEYGADDITVLEGLEAVRKRPGMYIGSTGERGLHHLVYEVVDNSVDEALAGYCDHIEVALQADGGVRVSDNGRGIPVDMHPTEKRPTVEVVMTILHAGGKFGSGGYAVSGGLHGVGVSVVNALSTRMDTVVKRQGYAWRQSFGNGGIPSPNYNAAKKPKKPARNKLSTQTRKSLRPLLLVSRFCGNASSRWPS